MARTKTDELVSSYYPPRARWWSRLFVPWFRFQRVFHLEKIHLPVGVSAAQFLLSLIIPGFGPLVCGRKTVGLVMLPLYCAAAIGFLGGLGSEAATLSYSLLISIHATSIFFLLLYWMKDAEFGVKAGVAAGTLLAVFLLVYLPVTRYIQNHWFMPLRVAGRLVVISRATAPESIHRGDWAAYSVTPTNEPGARIKEGFVLGPVLAVAGDRVEFDTNKTFRVNGVAYPALPNMPASGEVTVQENRWLVWPDFDIYGGHGNVNVSAILLQTANVSREQFVGRPFKSWFFRKQVLRSP